MGNIIYTKSTYNIYRVGRKSYIVHNTKKNFYSGHTHVQSYYTGKTLINMCVYKTIPDHFCRYLLQSLIRISDDESYIRKIEQILNNTK